MPTNRRDFIKSSLAASLAFSFNSFPFTESFPQWSFTPLKTQLKDKIIIKSITLYEVESEWLLVVQDHENRLGITQCNARMKNLTSLLKGLVIPHFLNKDVRDLPHLVDNAYRLNSNYKYTGMPLWNCIGTVEIACWDLLGKIAQKPVAQMLGKPIRSDYGIYISDFKRTGDVTEIAESLLEKTQATGAKGVKIKVGGRMQNTPENTRQTNLLVPAVRKILGDEMTIYADANGSFDAKEGIETGRLLEDFGVSIFEEPCNFEDETNTLKVSKALQKLKLAGGEQDTSTYKFNRLAKKGIYDILQPDLYYNGGILRALQVAEIARQNGRLFAPHSPKADPLIGPFWQVISLTQNLYGLQEGVYNPGSEAPSWYQPEIKLQDGRLRISQKIGLGIVYDKPYIIKGNRILG